MIYLIIYYIDVNGYHVESAHSTMDYAVEAIESIRETVDDPNNYDILEVEVD